MSWKIFRSWKISDISENFPLYIRALKWANFQIKLRRWKFNKIRWIGKFLEVEKFPINRKIIHFISEPLSVPIIRSNWEGGNFSNKIRWIGKFPEVEKFPINRKIFHLTNFKKMVAKNGGEQKAVGNKKKGEKNRKNRWKKNVRNFKKIIKILFFFELFWENVLKTLLRGCETTRKKYWVIFEKFLKYVFFSTSPARPPPPPSPFRQY